MEQHGLESFLCKQVEPIRWLFSGVNTFFKYLIVVIVFQPGWDAWGLFIYSSNSEHRLHNRILQHWKGREKSHTHKHSLLFLLTSHVWGQQEKRLESKYVASEAYIQPELLLQAQDHQLSSPKTKKPTLLISMWGAGTKTTHAYTETHRSETVHVPTHEAEHPLLTCSNSYREKLDILAF